VEPDFYANTTLSVGDTTDALHVHKEHVDTSLSLASTYGAIIRSQAVLGPVIQELGLETPWQKLKDRVQVALNDVAVPTITVSVRAESPREAEEIATSIARQTVSLSPAVSGAKGLSFAARRASQLEAEIRRRERGVAQLEGEEGSQARLVGSRREQEQFDLFRQWRGNYKLIKQLYGRVHPNTVRILEETGVNPAPLRPKSTLFVVLGLAAGLTAGAGVVSLLSGRRRPASSGLDPWLVELLEV
jgi:capsular polysaccharide biosynthesis protein